MEAPPDFSSNEGQAGGSGEATSSSAQEDVQAASKRLKDEKFGVVGGEEGAGAAQVSETSFSGCFGRRGSTLKDSEGNLSTRASPRYQEPDFLDLDSADANPVTAAEEAATRISMGESSG